MSGAANGVPHPVAQSVRLESLDVLRGFALLGILAMNVMVFAMPMAAYSNPTVFPEYAGLNRPVYWIVHIIFDLKMMGLFSMLFGAGVIVWDQKLKRSWASDERAREKRHRRQPPGRCRACGHDLRGLGDMAGVSPCPECGAAHEAAAPFSYGTGLWLRRMFWLLVIGMVHGWLIWEGDILVSYALCGILVLWWLRRLPTAWLIVAAGGFFAVHLLLVAGQGFNTWVLFSDSAAAVEMRESMTPEQIEAGREGVSGWTSPTPEQVREQIATLQGGWWEVFNHRAGFTLMMQTKAIPFYIFWRATAMMLLGAALMKAGILGGARPARFYGALAAVGYAIGVPTVAGGILYNESHGFELVRFALFGTWFNVLGSVAVMLGHVGLLVWVVKRGLLRTLVHGLARVGQMAFTNYLMQSVLCSLIFYGWGLGLAGELSRLQQELVVVGIWVVEILWSVAWLSRFRFGPAEWLWRSLTYWRLQPMRLDAPG